MIGGTSAAGERAVGSGGVPNPDHPGEPTTSSAPRDVPPATAERGYDAIVVGSGPNGLAAAVTLARAGCSVLVLEAADTIGGGTRSASLTLPGFVHDICSAIHPLGLASPAFQRFDLDQFGLEWIQPPLPLAHPLDDGTAAILDRSVEKTAARLGNDAEAYQRLIGPIAQDTEKLIASVLGPLAFPRHPLALARFAPQALRSAIGLTNHWFHGDPARALFAGMAAHAIMPLDKRPTAAFGLLLGALGHAVGWPIPRGGSGQIADALAAALRAHGGEIQTGQRVDQISDLPPAKAILFDVAPTALARIAADRLPARYRRQLTRYRYGPGVFKVDWALDGPIPWTAPECHQAGTVHVGGGLAEIAAAEQAAWFGRHTERPFVLVAQQSRFDPSRAPTGKHTVWAYCHVPNGSTQDMTGSITAQIERFAPGFQERILATHTMTATDLERYNPNYVGGDINTGVQDLWQLYTRPTPRLMPYTTPAKGIYLCSSATPPGGGVHGLCGYFAAQAALRQVR